MAYGQKSIIGSSEFRRNLYGIYTEIKSLTKILDENALEFLASGRNFIMDCLRLDILAIIFTRIFNYNLYKNLTIIFTSCVTDYNQSSSINNQPNQSLWLLICANLC